MAATAEVRPSKGNRWAWYELVMRETRVPSDRAVAFEIAKRSNAVLSRPVGASISSLEETTGFEHRQVIRSTKRLRDLGFLKVGAERGPRNAITWEFDRVPLLPSTAVPSKSLVTSVSPELVTSVSATSDIDTKERARVSLDSPGSDPGTTSAAVPPGAAAPPVGQAPKQGSLLPEPTPAAHPAQTPGGAAPASRPARKKRVRTPEQAAAAEETRRFNAAVDAAWRSLWARAYPQARQPYVLDKSEWRNLAGAREIGWSDARLIELMEHWPEWDLARRGSCTFRVFLTQLRALDATWPAPTRAAPSEPERRKTREEVEADEVRAWRDQWRSEFHEYARTGGKLSFNAYVDQKRQRRAGAAA